MSYKKVDKILPVEVIKLIQNYIDGELIYIPRKEENRKIWGEGTNIRKELYSRNKKIYEEYLISVSIKDLSKKYYLSEKSISRIIREQKNI